MATAQLKLSGVDELRRALIGLPQQLVNEATPIVQAAGNEHARQVTAIYGAARRTGNLQGHVRVEHTVDNAHTTTRVLSTARHAYIYERGTKQRAWKNGKSTGVMPAANQFVPLAQTRRQIMRAGLIEVVERAGLKVTGTSA